MVAEYTGKYPSEAYFCAITENGYKSFNELIEGILVTCHVSNFLLKVVTLLLFCVGFVKSRQIKLVAAIVYHTLRINGVKPFAVMQPVGESIYFLFLLPAQD